MCAFFPTRADFLSHKVVFAGKARYTLSGSTVYDEQTDPDFGERYTYLTPQDHPTDHPVTRIRTAPHDAASQSAHPLNRGLPSAIAASTTASSQSL